jgi:hypothetical protein
VTGEATGDVLPYMRTAALISLLAIGLSGCGGSSGFGSEVSPDAKAKLTVEHVLDLSSARYIDGSVWHLRVLDSEGAAILDRKLLDNRAALALEPGRYRLESEEFPCPGNCGNLDVATDGCSTQFEATPGEILEATVTLRPTEGCEIQFAPEPAT